MRTVWKFTLPIQGEVIEIEMPKGAEILHVGSQPYHVKGLTTVKKSSNEQVCLWVLVESDHKKEIRRFRIHRTGHPLVNNVGTGYDTFDTYVGTAVMLGIPLVWHVFEVRMSLPKP